MGSFKPFPPCYKVTYAGEYQTCEAAISRTAPSTSTLLIYQQGSMRRSQPHLYKELINAELLIIGGCRLACCIGCCPCLPSRSCPIVLNRQLQGSPNSWLPQDCTLHIRMQTLTPPQALTDSIWSGLTPEIDRQQL